MKKSFVLKKGAIVLSALAVTAGITVHSAAFANEVQPQQLSVVEPAAVTSSEYNYTYDWQERDASRRPSFPFSTYRDGIVKFAIKQLSSEQYYTDVSYRILKDGQEVTHFDVIGNYSGDRTYYNDIYLDYGHYEIQVINFSRKGGPGEGDPALTDGLIQIKTQQ